jgi:hypothetical protein
MFFLACIFPHSALVYSLHKVMSGPLALWCGLSNNRPTVLQYYGGTELTADLLALSFLSSAKVVMEVKKVEY